MASNMSAIAASREIFVETGILPRQHHVRGVILESWQRSIQHGLDPKSAFPIPGTAANLDTQLMRAARPVIDKQHQSLSDSAFAITLTDQDGQLYERWVADSGMARTLDARQVFAGYDVLSETAVGTASGGIALETGHSVMVIGAEHFSEAATNLTSCAAVIRHPLSRKVVGAVNLVAVQSDTTPLMLSWIDEVAAAVERNLTSMVSRRERSLLAAYLGSAKDSRHPVMCLNAETSISNSAASRMVSAMDQAVLWEIAAAAIDGNSREVRRVTLSSGAVVSVECSTIDDGIQTVGAMLKLRRDRLRHTDSPDPLSGHGRSPAPPRDTSIRGLVGNAGSWKRCAEAVGSLWATVGVVVLAGESGTGRTAIAHAITGSVGPELETTVAEALAAMDNGPAVFIIEDLDAATPTDVARLCERVRNGLPVGSKLVATVNTDHADRPGQHDCLVEWAEYVVEVPPLRDRIEDLPELLQTLTTKALARPGGPMWRPQTVQTLMRIRWHRNISSVAGLVREVLNRTTTAYIEVADLPHAIQLQGARRQLTQIEQAEARAIVAALREGNDNKKRAAEILGIARSTLYRKVRALGIDLSVANY